MADPKLIPPKLPELVQIAAPFPQALNNILMAMRPYEKFKEHYERTAKTFHDGDVERRQKQRLLQQLAKQEAALTERVKRRLLREHSARANNPPGPAGETKDQRAQRLLNERYERESTERVPTPQPRPRFNIKNLMPGAILKSLRSEHTFAALRTVQQNAAEIRIRMLVLNGDSDAARANTQVAFDGAAKAFQKIVNATNEAQQRRGEMSNGERLILRKLQASIASASKRIDAGCERFDAHGIQQQNQPALRRHYEMGIQPDGPSEQRPSRRTDRGTAPSSTSSPQQRKDHPLLAQYGLRSPQREPTQTLPPPARGRRRV